MKNENKILEILPYGVVCYDKECRRTYVNKKWEQINGFLREDVLYKTPVEISGLSRVAAVNLQNKIENIIKSGESDEWEVELVSKEGDTSVYYLTAVAEFDFFGNVTGVVATAKDITQKAYAKKELKEKISHYNNILDNSTDVIYLIEVTKEGRFVHKDVNNAYLAETGLKREDIIDRYVDELENKEFREILIDKYSSCIKAGSKCDYTGEYNFPSGKKTVHSTLSPVFDDTGRICQIVGVARDVTEIKKAQKELKYAVEFSQGIINSIPDLLFETDKNGYYLNFWYHDKKLVDVYKEKLVGKNISDILPPEASEVAFDTLNEADLKGKALSKPYRIVENLCEKWYEVSSVKMENGNFLSLAKDITHAKQLETQTRLAAIGEMMGNIAHQWRQPLSIISMQATGILMKRSYGKLDDETLEQACESITRNIGYLSQTIDDFRDFIKGERLKKRFKASKMADGFLSLIEASVKINHIKVIKDIDQKVEIEGYQNELNQCFMNIYNNAKDIMEEKNKEEERFFFIDIYEKNGKVHIIFKDNGGGIPKDIIPKIFDPYFTTKHQSQGTGLGLHMTYKLITQSMHGIIRASNIEYVHNDKIYTGAKFEIIL